MPEISVIIPSYNHAHFIAKAVQSVLTQTHSDLELLVVDDGSTDNSLEILGRFSDTRLQIISQENQGAHAAINHGLTMGTGRFLAILNSDDVYHPQRFEKIIPLLKNNHHAGLVGSYIEIIDNQGRSLGVKRGYENFEPWPLAVPERSFREGTDLHAALLTENYLSTTSNYVFKRVWYDQIGEFRPLRYAHDWDFALRMAQKADILLFPEPLMQYRVHASNTIRENHAAMIFEICWCLAVHLPRHIALPWFTTVPEAQRSEQLLHSIYTFECEQVLSALLLQRLSENHQKALELLASDNLSRTKYIDFITRRLTTQTEKDAAQLPQRTQGVFINKIKQLVSRWKAL